MSGEKFNRTIKIPAEYAGKVCGKKWAKLISIKSSTFTDINQVSRTQHHTVFMVTGTDANIREAMNQMRKAMKGNVRRWHSNASSDSMKVSALRTAAAQSRHTTPSVKRRGFAAIASQLDDADLYGPQPVDDDGSGAGDAGGAGSTRTSAGRSRNILPVNFSVVGSIAHRRSHRSNSATKKLQDSYASDSGFHFGFRKMSKTSAPTEATTQPCRSVSAPVWGVGGAAFAAISKPPTTEQHSAVEAARAKRIAKNQVRLAERREVEKVVTTAEQNRSNRRRVLLQDGGVSALQDLKKVSDMFDSSVGKGNCWVLSHEGIVETLTDEILEVLEMFGEIGHIVRLRDHDFDKTDGASITRFLVIFKFIHNPELDIINSTPEVMCSISKVNIFSVDTETLMMDANFDLVE